MLRAEWLERDLERLVSGLRGLGLPIALALAAFFNPLDTPARIGGLVTLLRSVPDVLLLRGDLASLGALAHGASAAAYGTTSSNRHVWLPRRRIGTRNAGTRVAAIVPWLLDHVFVERLEQLAAMDVDPACWCRNCEGAPLARLARVGNHKLVPFHDLACIRDLADQILAPPNGDREGTWRSMCADALERQTALPNQVQQRRSRAVEAWLQV